MFDELHDPDPPAGGVHTLANVTTRARRLRRRRELLLGAAAGLVVVAALGAALVFTGDDDDDGTLVDVSPTSIDTAPTDATTDATSDETTAPTSVTTVAPATTIVAATTTEVQTTTSDTSEPDSTVAVTAAPTTTVAETTTTVAPTTTTIAPFGPPLAAIDANGDAVLVGADGTKTVLFDGPGPDEPAPEEGDTYGVDSVSVTDDRSVAFVGTCCEPVVGTIIRINVGGSGSDQSTFGHAPTLSPDGARLASDALGAIQVSDLDLNVVATTADDYLGTGAGIGFIWIDDRRFVVLVAEPGSLRLQELTLAADNTLQPGPSWSAAIDGFGTGAAGVGAGVVYVRGLTPAVLSAFDSTTLQPVPARDITLPAAAISAWVEDGSVRWIDEGRRLHVGDTIVPGSFIWVR